MHEFDLSTSNSEHQQRRINPIRIEKDAWYSDEDVAALLGVSTDTLRRHRHQRIGLPFKKFGRKVFYCGSAIAYALAD